MSTLSQFIGGGVKSLQSGYVDASSSSLSSGSGEDLSYLNVTISPVNSAKAEVSFIGSGGFSTGSIGTSSAETASRVGTAWEKGIKASGNEPSGNASPRVTARLINASTLRLSTQFPMQHLSGRWLVKEYY